MTTFAGAERLRRRHGEAVSDARRRLAEPEVSYPNVDFSRARTDVRVEMPDGSRKPVKDYLQYVIDNALTDDGAAVALHQAFASMNDRPVRDGERIVLGYDWAPFSFSFAYMIGYGQISGLTGGLIYDGEGFGDYASEVASNGGMPSLTVNLSPRRDAHRWSMHT